MCFKMATKQRFHALILNKQLIYLLSEKLFSLFMMTDYVLLNMQYDLC